MEICPPPARSPPATSQPVCAAGALGTTSAGASTATRRQVDHSGHGADSLARVRSTAATIPRRLAGCVSAIGAARTSGARRKALPRVRHESGEREPRRRRASSSGPTSMSVAPTSATRGNAPRRQTATGSSGTANAECQPTSSPTSWSTAQCRRAIRCTTRATRRSAPCGPGARIGCAATVGTSPRSPAATTGWPASPPALATGDGASCPTARPRSRWALGATSRCGCWC
jgi:hypothetical protein